MYSFAPTFVDPKGSPIRGLFKYMSQSGMISFAGGSPAFSLFDVAGLDRASQAAFKNSYACLQYGATPGSAALRQETIKLMAGRGSTVHENELLITTGSQQGLDFLLRVMISPGDTVLVEDPAYAGTLQALRLQGAAIHPVPSDHEGLDIDALERLLSSGSIQPKPKLLYTVPNFANPTGATLSKERRLRLLELVKRYKLLAVEDDPYGQIRFTGKLIPSLLSLSDQVAGSREWIVHLSSLSKIVAPGLRVGWAVAAPEITRRCVVAKETADLCSPPWTQEIAATYLKSEDLAAHIASISAAYGAKCQAMCGALRRHLGNAVSFAEPDGGLFVWARLADGVDAGRVLEKAIERGVMFVPGPAFYAGAGDRSTLRLSYATASLGEIEEGVARLASAFRAVRQ